MCGIVGYIGKKNALDVVIAGLEHLEYRGYDSCGIAINTWAEDKKKSVLVVEKAVGKLSVLKEKIAGRKLIGFAGIGHTRWATHGVPSFMNAHPHHYGRVALVHNGILENHILLKQELIAKGHHFYSTTDTEVAAHLLDEFLKEGQDVISAIRMLCNTVHGTYALGIMVEGEPDCVYFAKHGSPLIVAKGHEETFFTSDQAALLDYQPVFYALKDQEIGFIAKEAVNVYDLNGNAIIVDWRPLTAKKEQVQKLGHKYFMHKEIFEQKETIDRVLAGRILENDIDFTGFGIDFSKILRAQKVQIVGCGSAYFAGLLAKPLLEAVLRVPVEVEIASEYRYRRTLTDNKTLVIAISQSGETVDTLGALEKAQVQNSMVMSICNVLGSSIATAGEKNVGNFYLNAGPEISVASTKAFLAQVLALRILSIALEINLKKSQFFDTNFFRELANLKRSITAILSKDDDIRTIAKALIDEPRMFYLGRADFYPVALEGALKMKELSYIFAEGYPAGELKHGPIAIIDPGMPVIIIFGSDPLQIKTASNLQEVKAREAKIISILPEGNPQIKAESDLVIEYSATTPLLEPLLATIPLQLLAYHLSDLKGIDVDKPRNLAKSVTVE